MTTTNSKTSLNPVETLIFEKIKDESKSCPMVSIVALRRSSAGISRGAFDTAVLGLSVCGMIDIYRSDLPRKFMTDYERDGVISLGNISFNACSIRKS